MLHSSASVRTSAESNLDCFSLCKGGDFLSVILTSVETFLTAVTGNAVTFGIVTVMIAGAIGRFAFKAIKRFIH